MWRWDQTEPFGNNPADEDPDANSVAFDLPLRLPGQRYDKETALHYNYFRDYDPSLGIYKQSDLIGLNGGLNTYVYGLSSPLSFVDAFGLAAGRKLPGLPTPEEVTKVVKDALNKKVICITERENCGDLHVKINRFCTGLFAHVAMTLCRHVADEVGVTCAEDIDRFRCPKVTSCLPVVMPRIYL